MKQFLRSSSSLIAMGCAAALLVACSSSDDPVTPADQLPLNPDENSSPSPTIDLVPDTRAATSIGEVFTSDEGLTLYTRFTDDTDIVSCVDACATVWPPLTTDVTTTGISGQFDVVERPDGGSQWTLNGYPLHTYSGDAAQGDIAGEGLDGEWAVARPLPISSADVSNDEALVTDTSTITEVGDPATRNSFEGRTLYFFASDTANASACNDSCAATWPPVYADNGSVGNDNFSLVARDDNTTQWAYNGQALYFYAGDNAAGDTLGDGIGGVWSIARP